MMLTILIVYYIVSVASMIYISKDSLLYGTHFILSSFVAAPFIMPLIGTTWLVEKIDRKIAKKTGEVSNFEADMYFQTAGFIWLFIIANTGMIVLEKDAINHPQTREPCACIDKK